MYMPELGVYLDELAGRVCEQKSGEWRVGVRLQRCKARLRDERVGRVGDAMATALAGLAVPGRRLAAVPVQQLATRRRSRNVSRGQRP